MDIYFAGSRNKDLEPWIYEHGYYRLLSYVNDKKAIQYWIDYKRQNPNSCKLFVDSGAFSMWTRGDVINVDQYIKWLNNRKECIDLFGQVDVIPGEIHKKPIPQQVEEAATKTWENYLYMRERVENKDGLLYTFHVGEDVKHLKIALEYRTENNEPIKYLALGGMVGRSIPVKKSFLDLCFGAIKDSSNPDVKVHTFGMTSPSLLSQYPITSADSTGWLMTSVNGFIYTKFGTIRVSDRKNQKTEIDETSIFAQGIDKDSVEDTGISLTSLRKEEVEALEQYITEKGFSLEELQVSYLQREKFNITYLAECMKNLVQKKAPLRTLKLFD